MSVPFGAIVHTFGVFEVNVTVSGADVVAEDEKAPEPGAIGSGDSGNVIT
jgi:hypothetical protein